MNSNFSTAFSRLLALNMSASFIGTLVDPEIGKRIRPTGGSVVIPQKPPIGVRAKRLAVRWKTLPMIRGIHYEK
jgi:hypothetical protein